MYRDIHFDAEKKAIVTTAGVTIVENIDNATEAFPLLCSCGELEKRMLADAAKKDS